MFETVRYAAIQDRTKTKSTNVHHTIQLWAMREWWRVQEILRQVVANGSRECQHERRSVNCFDHARSYLLGT